MKDTLKLNSLKGTQNIIIEKSLKTCVKEDRTIKIIAKEITEFLLTLFDKSNEK